MKSGTSTEGTKIRIVQVDEKAFIVQERGVLWGWNTWGMWSEIATVYHQTLAGAKEEIRGELESRKMRENSRAFPSRVVWP